MSKKDLSIVHVFAPNILAGAERVVLTGLEALIEARPTLKIKIYIIEEARNKKWANDFIKELHQDVKYEVISAKNAYDPLPLIQIAKNLKNDRPQIIHTHGYKALIYSFLSNTIKSKIIHTHHGNTSHTLKVKLYEWLSFQFMKHIKQVIAVSQKMQLELMAKSAIKNKISTIENMLSFKNVQKIKDYQISLDNKKIELIYIGRLSPEKGILYFLEFFLKYSKNNLFHLTILGDGPEMLAIKKLINDEQSQDLISIIGFVGTPADYLKKADILIMPSFTEGMPLTLIESLACGIPVIANNVGAISELLVNTKNGLLLEGNTINNWKLALDQIPTNLSLYKEYAKEHAQEIEDRYSAKKWADKTIQLYLKMLE